MRYLIYDIETVMNDMAKDYYAEKEYSAPANYKDPEKIRVAVEESRAKDSQRSGLYWWTAKIICIGVTDVVMGTSKSFCFDDEKTVLQQFFAYINEITTTTLIGTPVILVGKSSEEFDKPMIVGRALANEISIPNLFKAQHPIRDVDHMFSKSRSCAQVSSLSNYAWGLGIGGKINSGSQVQAMYDAGEIERIKEYCLDDNRIVAEMIKRYNQ
jgi:hypothetical protein